MQAFAISVVLMSSACGGTAATTQDDAVREIPAVTRTLEDRHESTPIVASCAAQRYDIGKGKRHVAPLSSRRDPASGQR
jgi:hypothetical protein